MIDMPLATTLRLLARARGLSAAQIAQAVPRVGAATVNAWLRGEKLPGQAQLEALARAFGVPAAALLSELAGTMDPARDDGERALLAAWRTLAPAQRDAVLQLLGTMSAPPTPATTRTPAPPRKRPRTTR